MKQRPSWEASFDDRDDAVFSLQMVSELLPKIREHDGYWKWIILALHNALQGFMVLAVKGSSGFGAIYSWTEKEADRPRNERNSRKSRKDICEQWEKFFSGLRDGRPPKEPMIAGFPELYEYIQSPDVMQNGRCYGSRPFVPSQDQTLSVKVLADRRNQLVHFPPNLHQAISCPRFLGIADDCVDIISFLAIESHNILWRPDGILKTRTRELITKIKQDVRCLEEEMLEDAL